MLSQKSDSIEKMSKMSKVALWGVVVGAVVFVGVLLGWLGTKREPATSQSSPTPPPVAQQTNQNPIAVPPSVRSSNPVADLPTNPPVVTMAGSETNVLADWENKLDEILAPEGEPADKAKRLFELFPRLPRDGQVEVAQHLSNLVSDKDYAPLGKLLADAKQPEPVLDVLFGDVLNRPNSLKLPALLDVARDPDHPKAGDAKEILAVYLDQDFGNDWTQWQARMEQWLKDNPD